MDGDVYVEVAIVHVKLPSTPWHGGNLGPLSSLALRFLWPCHWINRVLPGFGTFPERKGKFCHQATMLKDVERPPKHGDNAGMKWDNAVVFAAQVSLMSVLIEPLSLWGFDGCWRGKVAMYHYIWYIWIYSVSLHLFVVSSCVWMCYRYNYFDMFRLILFE